MVISRCGSSKNGSVTLKQSVMTQSETEAGVKGPHSPTNLELAKDLQTMNSYGLASHFQAMGATIREI